MSKKIIVTLYFIFAALFFSIPLFSQETSIGAEALCQQGIQYYEQGLSRLAAEYFRRCLQQDPANQQAKKYLGIIGQAYIAAVAENARQQYETALDVAETRSGSRYQASYDTMTQSTSRNLDYRTAESSPVITRQAQSAQQVAQQAVREAKEDFASQYNIREEAIAQARQDYVADKRKLIQEKNRKTSRKRSEVINKILEDANFKMDLEYQFVSGENSFLLVDPNDGTNMSKLTFPTKGGMAVANMEAKILPRFFAGGRFGISNLDVATSQDEDWDLLLDGDYYYTKQRTKNEAQLWDANIYYRMFDWSRQDLDDYLKDMFLVDRLYVDIFGGYQYYKGRATMIDPIVHEYWEVLGVPVIDDTSEQSWGLNSHYETIRKGPRLGVRLGGSLTEKLSSNLSFAYAWLDTKSYGNWNLRNFNWTHESGDGYGFNFDLEALYHLAPDWYLGAGYHYLYYVDENLLYSGDQPSGSFKDLDIARDSKVVAYGPSIKLGCRF